MQPLDPAGSSRRAHSYSSRASPGEKVLQQRRPSSSQTLFTPAPAYGPLPPRAPSPLSAASAVAQRHRDSAATVAGAAGLRTATTSSSSSSRAPPPPGGSSSSNAFRERRAHGSSNALNMHDLGGTTGSGTGVGASAEPGSSRVWGSVAAPAAASGGHSDGGGGRQLGSGHSGASRRGGAGVASLGPGFTLLLPLDKNYRIPLPPIGAAGGGPKMRRSATEPCECRPLIRVEIVNPWYKESNDEMGGGEGGLSLPSEALKSPPAVCRSGECG